MSKFCTSCGGVLKEDTMFCNQCGTKVGQTSPNNNNNVTSTLNKNRELVFTADKPKQVIIGYTISAISSILFIVVMAFLTQDIKASDPRVETLTNVVYFFFACFVYEAIQAAYLISKRLVIYTDGLEIQTGTLTKTPFFVPFSKIDNVGIVNSVFHGKKIAYGDGLSVHKIAVNNPEEVVAIIEKTKAQF